jgi:hypothetical protein
METGEVRECKLVNGNGEAERFYRQLPSPALIGVEACGNSQWFVDRLGLEMRLRFEPVTYASRRPTGAMRDTF